ncbi:hypothetical protein M885DRAFT_512233 [Pelagophyceae sp. CCMP2097]|nr:hypothetical protein M885DRAFT_512233 [Pelagophyceae sp. CCMP2097]|mmetsp:Transcript_20380/g.69075  ORF Transcript_20380/g.69075 Transcript_20380/m.69075 type:complete len:207 (-) Transcript_20380:80-700(-)
MYRDSLLATSNEGFVATNGPQLKNCAKTLTFMSRAFFALGLAQLFFQGGNVFACADDFAFSLFLRGAERRLNRLIHGETGRSAAAELADVLSSICDVHSIFAWVISFQAVQIVCNKLATPSRMAYFAKLLFDVDLGPDADHQRALSDGAWYYAKTGWGVGASLLVAVALGVAVWYGKLTYFKTKYKYYKRAAREGTFTSMSKAKRV